MSTDPNLHTLEYDHLLDKIEHYRRYDRMRPWIGNGYPFQSCKVLLVAESHYVGREFKFHLDPAKWYAGVDTETSKGFWTRDIISNGIKNKWRKKEAILYRNIDSALRTSSLFSPCPANAFTEVAFMNYFQRPADTNGDSIQVHQQDAQVANEVFRAVVHAISPDIVIFCSSLAYRNAKKFEVPNFLNLRNVLCGHVPHAGMPWWNRVAKKYGGRTGKQVFADFIEQKVLLELKRTA